MNDFKKSLDEAIENSQNPKRKEEASSLKSESVNPVRFSFKTFSIGLVLGLIIYTTLAAWAWSNKEKTFEATQSRLPSKTAIVTDFGIHASQTTVVSIPENNADKLPTPPSKAGIEMEPLPPKETAHTKDIEPTDIPDFIPKSDKPLLSILFVDMGLSDTKTNLVIEKMPSEIGFSFSPYTKNLDKFFEKTKHKGHETWMGLPLETKEYPLNDNGPLTIMVNASTEKNMARLKSVLEKSQSIAGFTTPPFHVFESEDGNINPAIDEIFHHGYALIDTNISLKSFVESIAYKKNYPYAQATIWLDVELSPLSINRTIRSLSDMAKNKQNVILIAHPYPASITAIEKFLNSQSAKEFELAPPSTQLKNKKPL